MGGTLGLERTEGQGRGASASLCPPTHLTVINLLLPSACHQGDLGVGAHLLLAAANLFLGERSSDLDLCI